VGVALLLEEQNCLLCDSLSCQDVIWSVCVVKIVSESMMVTSCIVEH